MQSQYLAFLASMLAIQASARPSEITRRDWVSNSKGNLIVTFSDQTVKLGTIPISVIMSNVDNACSDNGLCQTNEISVTGQLVESSDVYDETLTITPNGDYPSWIHNGLWDALNAAINSVAKCSTVTNDPVCPDPEAYCPSTPITVSECVVPQFVGVNFQPSDLGNAAPPFMEFGLSIAVDSTDFCSTFATVGSAVAGSVNAVAGGLFTLFGLACQS